MDLDNLDEQLKGGVAALVVNNPNNPCGSVYSKSHLLDILALAEKHRVPIISDEVYAYMVICNLLDLQAVSTGTGSVTQK